LNSEFHWQIIAGHYHCYGVDRQVVVSKEAVAEAIQGDSKMHNVLFVVISMALLAVPFHALAQEPTTPGRPDVTAPPESSMRPADASIGKWVGDWQCSGACRNYGSMEMEVDVNGDQVTGQVISTAQFKTDCSLKWEKLAGVRKGEKIFAQYNLGGRCGTVDLIFSIDMDGRIMMGTWASQWPSNGTFRLKKAAS